MRREFAYVITCEHASPQVPERWLPALEPLLAQCEEHRVWDPGTAEIGAELARLLDASFFPGNVCRLVVDLNRSLTHRDLFSAPIAALPDTEKTAILCRHYYPYRHRVLQEVESLLTANKCVLHLSIHSFTPSLDGEVRENDLGLLFDPWRKGEKDLADVWLHYLRRRARDLICLPNRPYLGISDGHAPVLRKLFRRQPYLGFELEFNQKLPLSENAGFYARWAHRTLMSALESKTVAHLNE